MNGLVTVFGGSGFVGTQVVRALAKRGWRIRVAVRNPHLAYKLRPLGDVGQIQLVQANIAVRSTVERALEGAEAAVNLVGLLYETPGRRFRTVHVEGARTVAEIAKSRGIERMVQVSAIGADPRSRANYARSKGEGEEAVKKVLPSATVVRPSIVFGTEDHFFNRFAAMATWSPALPLIGGGKTRFQPVFVGDVANAIERGLSNPDAAGKTYELGGPEVFTFRELMQIVLRETERRRLLLPIPFEAASLVGLAGDVMALTPIKPELTSDQVLLLHEDNVVHKGMPGLDALGITAPTGVEPFVSSYLWRYRTGGQFAEAPAA